MPKWSARRSTTASVAASIESLVRALKGRVEAIDRLTAREFEVCWLVAVGKVNKEVADEMGVSLGTVETHLRHIFLKVGIDRRAALAFLVARSCRPLGPDAEGSRGQEPRGGQQGGVSIQ